MSCRCQALLLTLLLAGWTWDARAQFGWGRKEREARVALNQRSELATQTPALLNQNAAQGSSSSSSPWQQPVSVSINPQRAAPTPVQPLPPLPPAPALYTLPNVGGTKTGFRAPKKPASSSSNGNSKQVNALQMMPGQSKVPAGAESMQQVQPGAGQNQMQVLAGPGQGSMQAGQQQQQQISVGADQGSLGFAGIPPGSTVIDVTEIPPAGWSPSNTVVPGNGAGSSTNTGSSNPSVNGGSSSNSVVPGSAAGGSTAVPISSNGGSSGGSSGGSGLGGVGSNGIIAQAPGTTVQVLAGKPGAVTTTTSGQGQQVTIISIMPVGNRDLAVSSSGGPATIWSSTGGNSQQQPQLQQPLSNSKQTGQQQILPAVPTDGLEDVSDSSMGQSGGSVGGASPDFFMGADPKQQGSLKPSFGGPGEKGRYGSRAKSPSSSGGSSSGGSKHKVPKQAPMMIPVGGAPDADGQLQPGAEHLFDAWSPADGADAFDTPGAAHSSKQQQQQQSPWNQQQKQKSTAPKARNVQTSKACGCPDFSFNFACGSDGVTYANPCMTQCAGAWVAYMGPCEPTWSALPKGSAVKGTVAPGSGSSSGSSEAQLPPVQDPKPAPTDSAAGGLLAGDYEYYYEDGRPPVPAPPRPHQQPGTPAPAAAAPAPLPSTLPVPIPVSPLPPSEPQDGTADGPYEDEGEESDGAGVDGSTQPQPMQPMPPGLPKVSGPEPIPEDESDIPVPPPTPISLTTPAPPKDTKGIQDKVPIPPGPRARPAAGAAALSAAQRVAPPASLPDARTQHVTAPKPWLLKQEGASATILLGCILPFEGDLRLAGNSIYHAMKLAVSEEAPKVLPDFNVNVTCINTKCADIPSHMAMTRFVKEKAVAVLGEVCSAATVAAAGVSTSSKLPLISPAATSPALSGEDFFFRTVPSDRFQGQAAANLLIKKGYRNVAMVYEDAAYGYGLAFNFMAAFTKEGGNVPVVVMFKKGQGKPKQDLLQVKADIDDRNLDAVFLATNNLTYAAAFLRAATNNDLGLKIFGGDALADTMMVSLLQDMPAALKDLSVTTVNKGKNPFIKRFREAFPTVTYGSFAAQAYDATVAVLRAYAAARPPRDGPELAKELRKQKFEGVSGPIAFDKNGDAIPHGRTYMWIKHNATTGVPVVRGYIERMV